MDIDNLATASPLEIDTAIAAIYQEIYKTTDKRDAQWGSVEFYANQYLGKGYRDVKATQGEIRTVLAEVSEIDFDAPLDLLTPAARLNASKVLAAFLRYEGLCEQVDTLWMSVQPYDEEYVARGRWTRAYLVDNSNGHVHSSMHCSSCFPTTRFHWLVEMADHTEAEIVEKAGERACTVCYPSAPVEVLSRPTQFFTPDEQAKARAREVREAARAAKEAATVVVPNYYRYGSTVPRTFTYKTPRAASNALAGELSSLCWYGMSHSDSTRWLANVDALREALAAKGVAYDHDKALAAARKKVTREGGSPKF